MGADLRLRPSPTGRKDTLTRALRVSRSLPYYRPITAEFRQVHDFLWSDKNIVIWLTFLKKTVFDLMGHPMPFSGRSGVNI